MKQIGLSAHGLNREVVELPVQVYSVIIQSELDDRSSKTQLTRKAARLAARSNSRLPVTDLSHFKLVALQPLERLQIEKYGFVFQLVPEEESLLRAEVEAERNAIQRLLNQDLYRAAWQYARERNHPPLQALRHDSGWTELKEVQPSDRIQVRSEYLDLYKTLRITPELLPNGQVILGLSMRHQICPHEGITLDWVINQRPQWLPHIQKVRHRYRDQGKPAVVAALKAVQADKNSQALLPGTQQSLYDYHQSKGHVQEGQEEVVRNSQVVSVSYNGKEAFDHLAALLEPMFDFETLQKIDSLLLNRIARDLKWSVRDRLKAAGQMIKGLQLPGFEASVVPMDFSKGVDNLRPSFSLCFHQGRRGQSEKDVLRLKAYRGMTRSQVVCLAVGTRTPEEALSSHFNRLRKACQALSAEPLPPWKGVNSVNILKDAQELDKRLSQTPPENTLLVIAIDSKADKRAIRDVAFRHKLACQFMLTDHRPNTYNANYYGNLAAGVFSKGGGLICALDQVPGKVDLFIGLDMGGQSQRAPGSAFLFTRNGAQLGWQLAEMQGGERLADTALAQLLEKSIQEYRRCHNDERPGNITLHRDGRFFESLEVVQQIEQQHGVRINVLEVIKSGAPILFRRELRGEQKDYRNPEVGDCYRLEGLDELILATYSGQELGKMGDKASVRPLRLRKRYGEETLDTLAQQVLLLSRIHGASLYRHPRLPVTTHHADRFATLRQESDLEALSHMDRTCPVYL